MEDIGETKAGGIQPQLSVGTPVYVNWNNSGHWRRGKVELVHPTGTYKILYDDGDLESNVPRQKIFSTSELTTTPQPNMDVERELWNNAPFGRGYHIMAGDNIFGIYPTSPCYFAMTYSVLQDDDGNPLTLNHHEDIQNTIWAQHCEAMARNRQAHGNLFEERVAAYISIEMYKLFLRYADNDSSILNAAYPLPINPLNIYLDWYTSQSQGMTDTYDIDFGSRTCSVSKTYHQCSSHFPYLETHQVFGQTTRLVLDVMRRIYGLGISVKTVKGAVDRRAPVNMGDLRRVSHEFNTTNSFTLIVGVWNKRNSSDNYEINHVCRTIENIYCSKRLNVYDRQLFFNNATHDHILRFANHWFPLGGNSLYNAETKQAFRKAAADLGTQISISPKMANLTKNRPARCQCAISNRLFNSLIERDFFRAMDMNSYPHLWRPMYKIEDNGNNDEGEEWAPVNQKQLNDEIEAEDQEQLDGALNPDAQIYELEENNEDGNVNGERKMHLDGGRRKTYKRKRTKKKRNKKTRRRKRKRKRKKRKKTKVKRR